MDIVNFLALSWGFSLAVIGLAFLLRPQNNEACFSVLEHDGTLMLYGLITTVLAVCLLVAYHDFTQSWTALLTALAFLMLLKGLAILFFPHYVKNTVAVWRAKVDAMLYGWVAVVLIGCLLVYLGMAF